MDKEVVKLVRQYIARLIKDHHFDMSASEIITIDDFPKAMVTERNIMRIISSANLLNVNMSPDDIAMQLVHVYKDYKSIDQAKEEIDTLMSEDTSDIISADALIFSLKSTMNHLRFLEDANSAFQAYIESPKPVTERIDDFIYEIIKNAPQKDNSKIFDWEERADLHEEKMRERFKQKNIYGFVGPGTPWPELQNILPRVDEGQVVLLQMVTGVGKSTVLPQIAEYQSMVQDYDVQMVTFETPHEEFADRQTARWCRINLDYLQSGAIDLDDKNSDQVNYYYAWKRWMKQMMNNHGRLYYDYLPNSSPSQVLRTIQRRKEQAKARGRKLVVMFDYMQVLPTNATDFFQKVQNRIDFAKQSVAENLALPVFMTAQSHVDDSNRTDKNKLFGGQYPASRSQLILDGVRANTSAIQKPINIGKNEQYRDIYGNKLWWISPPKSGQRTTSPSEEIAMTIVKANYGQYPVSCHLFTCDEINTWYNNRKDAETGSWIDLIKLNNGFPLWKDWVKNG